MTIKNEFNIGQEVYFRTDPEQLTNLITGILVREKTILYEVTYITQSSWHNAYELTSEKNILLSCGVPVEKQ